MRIVIWEVLGDLAGGRDHLGGHDGRASVGDVVSLRHEFDSAWLGTRRDGEEDPLKPRDGGEPCANPPASARGGGRCSCPFGPLPECCIAALSPHSQDMYFLFRTYRRDAYTRVHDQPVNYFAHAAAACEADLGEENAFCACRRA